MPERKLFTQAVGFVALAVAAGLLLWNSGRVSQVKPLRDRTADAVTRIVIDRPGQPEIDLDKQAGLWRVEKPVAAPADAQACDAAARALADMELGSVVSRDPGAYAAYQVDESSAPRVRAYLENAQVPVLDGYFGALSLGPDTAYFRAYREREVRLATGAGRSVFDRPLSGWTAPSK